MQKNLCHMDHNEGRRTGLVPPGRYLGLDSFDEEMWQITAYSRKLELLQKALAFHISQSVFFFFSSWKEIIFCLFLFLFVCFYIWLFGWLVCWIWIFFNVSPHCSLPFVVWYLYVRLSLQDMGIVQDIFLHLLHLREFFDILISVIFHSSYGGF